MIMKMRLYMLAAVLLAMLPSEASAQVDRKDVRRGNRDFRKENYKESEIDYRKALVKDSLSVAGNYNLANTLYRNGSYPEARQVLDKIKDVVPGSASAADYYFNLGDVAIQQQNWQAAVDAFRESLILRPEDLQAKENYIYAKKKLEDQQNQQQNQNQNQDNRNNDQNQDNNDQNQNQDDQDKDDQDNKDDQKNDRNQDDNNQDDQRQPPQNQQGQQPKITPQAAQQMLQAIQAKEKETQDKVNKQKAEALKSRQKEKNW